MKKNTSKIIIVIFLFLQTILYFNFMYTDMMYPGKDTSYLKYAIIILCLGVLLLPLWKNTHKHFLCYAIFFTVISDWFLLISGPYIIGLLTFYVAQQFHGRYLDELEVVNIKSKVKRSVIQIMIYGLICLMLALCRFEFSYSLFVTILYFISLLTNVYRSVLLLYRNKREPKYIFLAIGFLLFLCCDLNVGLYNLDGFVDISNATLTGIIDISGYLMWAFYAPSQVLITLSGLVSCRNQRS